MTSANTPFSSAASEEVLLQWLEGPFRLLAEHLPERILFKDRESRFLWVNQVMLKILGARSLEEILGKTDHDFFDAAHANQARADEIWVMETGQSIIDRVERDRDSDGDHHWIYTTRIPLRNARRDIAGVFVLVRDMTERYDAEQAALKAKGELELRVKERNATLARQNLEHSRVESELAAAREIQKRFAPAGNPEIPRIDLKGFYSSAHEVGGDYLDYFRTERGDWVIIIADVSGKGVPAALVMTMLRGAFHAEARFENTAKGLLCAVNEVMLKDLDQGTFVTACCVVIESGSAAMTYARAGHPPLLMCRGKNTDPEFLGSRGLPLGFAESRVFCGELEEMRLALEPGDALLLYTDGVTEASDLGHKIYGQQGLRNLMIRERSSAPERVIKAILDDVREFTRGQPHQDDLALLAMEVRE